tara:strand:- start:1402 stop:1722 length:321 start_codon:yes stop_codon:yes gene_type:complete
MDKELTPIVIDLTNKNQLDEGWLRMFGFWTKVLLKRMFGDSSVPVTIRGSKSDVASFANTISKEKRYMDSYMKYGLDNPRTYKNKSVLDSAVRSFERKTGLKWPLK